MAYDSCDLLNYARDFLAVPERWTKQTLYRDKNGHMVELEPQGAFNDPMYVSADEVTRCCLIGAVRLAALKLSGEKYESALHDEDGSLEPTVVHAIEALQETIQEAGKFASVAVFNDAHDTDHEDVIEVLDTTIKENCE